MKYVIFFDPNKCLGCRSCEIECAVSHSSSKNLLSAIEEKPTPEQRVHVEDLDGSPVPLLCKHCEAAPCIQVCPTEAIKKHSDGPVTVDSELCVGCSSCVIVCPWGIPRLDRNRKMIIKCDLCIDRLEEGMEPACVKACPTKALTFKSIDELMESKASFATTIIKRSESYGRTYIKKIQ